VRVLVLERDERDVDPYEPPDLARPDPGGGHHCLGTDAALVGDDLRHAPVLDLDVRDLHARADLRTPRAGARRQGARKVAGVYVPVGRIESRGQHPFRVEERKQLQRLLGADELQRKPEGSRAAHESG
jgi:hypothetical protein